jgi:hypothetical protein
VTLCRPSHATNGMPRHKGWMRLSLSIAYLWLGGNAHYQLNVNVDAVILVGMKLANINQLGVNYLSTSVARAPVIRTH